MPEKQKDTIQSLGSEETNFSSQFALPKVLVIVSVVIIATCAIMYFGYERFYLGFFGPVRSVNAQKISNSEIVVDLKTLFPAEVMVQYGTNKDVLGNQMLGKSEDSMKHSGKILVIPGKKHLYRIVATGEDGQTHKTRFYYID